MGRRRGDEGVLVTPGIQAFFQGRRKVSLNVDVFLPAGSDRDTEYPVKAQTYFYF